MVLMALSFLGGMVVAIHFVRKKNAFFLLLRYCLKAGWLVGIVLAVMVVAVVKW